MLLVTMSQSKAVTLEVRIQAVDVNNPRDHSLLQRTSLHRVLQQISSEKNALASIGS